MHESPDVAPRESVHADLAPAEEPSPRRRLHFSLKAMLLAVALVAAFFGGRASQEPWGAPRAGTWQMRLPAGFQESVPIFALGEGRFLLRTGGNLGGEYRWNGRRLVVETPEDRRFVGLAWVWEGDDLVLVAEPSSRPAGPSYLGARLRFVSADTSQADADRRRAAAARPAPASPPTSGAVGVMPRRIAVLPGFVADAWHAPPAGQWKLTIRPGPKPLTVQLVVEGEGLFQMTGAGAMSGRYAVKEGRLAALTPDDRRMLGLSWCWKGNDLVLVNEPSPPPTGSSYLGAKLQYVGPEQQPP